MLVAKYLEIFLELLLLLPSSFCSAVPDEHIKVRNIIFPLFVRRHVSLSEKYVKLDVLTAFIETFCRSMPQEQVSQDWHESSLRLLPTNSFRTQLYLYSHFSDRWSFLHHRVFYSSRSFDGLLCIRGECSLYSLCID